MAAKKITRVSSDKTSTDSFVPSPEIKSKATTNRIIAIVLWVIAIGAEVWGIFKLREPEPSMTWLIILIVVALIFAVVGNLLWKKANRMDPASKKDKVRFFIQNQLGALVSALAFLPLIILILTNKNIDGKQKGILGAIAGVALLIAVGTGVDTDPPSVEQYTEESNKVKELMGQDFVYWTKSGKKYHLYSSCGYINSDRTNEIFEGTVGKAKADKKISELCTRCSAQAMKENNVDLSSETDKEDGEEE